MPELGKATYRVDADITEFERKLAEARAEASAFAKSTDKELKKTQGGVDGLTSSFMGMNDALVKQLSPGGMKVLKNMGVVTDHQRETISRLKSEVDGLRTVWSKLGTVMGDRTQFQQANSEISKMEEGLKALQNRVDWTKNWKGFDTSGAERDLLRMTSMMDRFYKESTRRIIQQDRDLSRQFGLQGGGSRGGLLSRIMGQGYAVPAKDRFGMTSQEYALLGNLAAAGSGDGGGGGIAPRVPVGGGGGGGGFNPMQLLFRRGNGRFLGPLGAFGGLSLGTMLGLGPEHIIGVLGSLLGSAAGGLGGAGLLAAGSLGKLAVGGGSDMAVMKSTIADTQTLYKSYQNLQQAVAVYGKNSRQAAVAQRQLNYQMQSLGPAAGAELALAKQVDKLNTLWDKATANARKGAVSILQQIVSLGTAYVPLIAQAAQRNFAIINTGIKPLMDWLKGPQGLSAWHVLEDQFAKSLPTAIHAFTQGVELLIKIVSDASQYTGGFMNHLDQLFTKWNSPTGFLSVRNTMDKLLYDFHIWKEFIVAIGSDLYHLFHAGVGEGNNLVVTMTGVLHKWGQWEQSAAGSQWLHTFFYNRAQEVKALGHAVAAIAKVFGAFYTAVQPLVPVVTAIAHGIGDIVNWVVELGKHSSVIQDALVIPMGAFLLSWKMFGFGTTIGGAKNLFGKLGIGAAGTAAATGGATAAEGAAGGGLLAGVAGKTLAGASLGSLGLAAGGGIIGGSLAQGALGLRTGTAGTLGGGVLGAALGLGLSTVIGPLGPVVGTLLGSGIGSTLGPSIVHLLGSLFGGGESYGTKFGKDLASGLNRFMPGSVGPHLQHLIAVNTDKYRQGVTPTRVFTGGKGVTGVIPGQSQSQVNKDAFNVGWGVGQAMNQAIATAIQHGAHVTPMIIQNDFLPAIRQAYAKGGPIAGAEAARQMLEFAQSLESHGELPKGSVKNLIISLEQQFPQLRDAFKKLGVQTNQDLANALKFTDARDTLQQTIQFISKQWAISNISAKSDYHSMSQNVQTEAAILRDAMKSKNSAIRQDAQQAWAALVTDTENYAKSMAKKALDQMSNMNQKGSGQFWNMAGSAISALKSIGDNTDQALKALGLNPPQWKWALSVSGALGKQMQQQAFQQAVGPGSYGYNSPNLHAVGGFIGQQGEAGRDNVHVVLGRGEAILNRHQQKIVNAALANMGVEGLGDLYKKTQGKLHYMASGGYAGYSLPLPRSSMMPGGWSIDQGVDIPAGAGTPEFAIGPGVIVKEGVSGFGPNAPVLQITAGPLKGAMIYYGHAGPDTVRVGQLVHAGQQISEIGSGIVGISTGPHIEIGYYPPGGMGAGGRMALTLRQLLGGAGVTGVGGGLGAAFNQITAPKIANAGVFGSIINKSMSKVASAANQYLAKVAGSAVGPAGVMGSAAPVGNIMAIAQSAAQAAGVPWNAAIVQALLSHESQGGENLPPHNYGGSLDPAGPFQVISSTFGSYHAPGHDNRMNPLDNALAAFRWIRKKYGTLERMAAITGLFSGRYQGYAGGGGPGGYIARAASGKIKTKKTKKAKAHKMGKLPKNLKIGGDLDYASGLLNQINLDDGTISDLQGWQGYLQNLHGMTTLTQFLTMADGSQVINWGDPNGALGVLTGLVDPSTGQVTKSIWDRVREIGDRGTLDKNTELGIDDLILNAMLGEQSDANNAWKALLPYLDDNALGWLDNQLDPNKKGVELGKMSPWFHNKVYETARKYKNMLAKIMWAKKRKAEIPAERAKRDAAIAARFKAERHYIQNMSATGAFDASQWLTRQENILTNEERAASSRVQGTPPANWFGDPAAWALQAQEERAAIATEFGNRRAALREAAARNRFEGRIAKSNALYGIGQTEAAERLAERLYFDHLHNKFSGIITNDSAEANRDKGFLGKVDTQLHQVLDAGGLRDKLKSYIDPMGQLSLNIDTLQNIDIQGLLNERAGLLGSALPSNSGSTNSQQAIIDFQAQMIQQLSETLFIQNAQKPVLQAYETGTPYVPHTGPALVHEGEAIIPAEMNPFTRNAGMGSAPEVHIHGLGDFVERVEAVVDGKKLDLSEFVNHDLAGHARARRLLPSPITG